MYSSTLSLTSALGGGGWSTPSPGRVTRGKYSFYRRLDGTQGRPGRVREIYPPPGFDSRTVQPVAIRHTDYAIPAHWSGHRKVCKKQWDCRVVQQMYKRESQLVERAGQVKSTMSCTSKTVHRRCLNTLSLFRFQYHIFMRHNWR
jgi:hypothetical protein